MPHHLGDVPLFVSSSDGAFSSTFSLANPFTGSSGGNVGTFGRPIGDFDLREEDYNFYAFSLGTTDANSGNYLVINPENATIRSVADGQGAAFTDDEIETFEPDPNDPTMAVMSDEGVQFDAIAFFNDRVGYAIGHRENNPIENILYQFDVPRGTALGPEQDDALLSTPGTAMTNIVERGVIDLAQDAVGAGTILSVLQDVVVDGELEIEDGEMVSLGVGGGLTFEFNLGPEMIPNIDQLDGNFFVDGDRFTVNGVDYEVDTGSVLQISELDLADGDTFTVTNNNVVEQRQTTFEIDLDGTVADGNVAIAIEADADLATVVDAIVAAINGSGAELLASAFANRISLHGESRVTGVTSSSPGITVSGTPGVTSGRLLPIEETFNIAQVGTVLKATFGDQVSILNDRFIFPGATANFDELTARSVNTASDADSTVLPTSIAVDLLPTDTREDVALKLVAAINGNGGQALQNQWQVVLNPNTGASFDPRVSRSILSVGGTNFGGRATGLQFIGSQLYAVSDEGGLYEILGYAPSPNPATADYIETSTALEGIDFSGLTLGPQSIEGGRYANVFFATTRGGDIHAFDPTGLPQEVFVDGQTSVSTGISGANGLLFSPADENLWHITGRKGPDIGHGVLDDTGLRDFLDLGLSFHFGDNNPDLTENRNYNFPGGAHGSLVTDSFSLEGYTTTDQPVLYFNYFLTSDTSSGGQDSFRVFATDETADDDTRGEWVLLADNDPLAQFDPTLQPLFDNTWEDQPALFPGDPVPANNPAARFLRRNGIRDPYTTNRSNLDAEGDEQNQPPVPIPSEEASIWRQARIDLSNFAGSDSVRLRFDFSSAGTFGIGDPNTGGSELRTVGASLIADGDQFVIDDVVFEFDLGLNMDLPSGLSIVDGETVVLADPADQRLGLELVKADPTTRNILVPEMPAADGQTFSLVTADTTTQFEFDNDGGFAADVAVEIDASNVAQSVADAINDAGLSFTASVVGDRIQLSDPTVQVFAETSPLVDLHPVVLTDAAHAADVAQLVADGINNAAMGLSAVVINQRLALTGVADVDTAGGSAIQVSGSLGLSDPTVEGVRSVPINFSMTADEVAAAVSTAVADAFAGGAEETIKTYQNIVRIHGHVVTDPGPLGLADVLPGDDLNHLFSPIRGVENQLQYNIVDPNQGNQNNDMPFQESGSNNFVVPYEGVYVDDVIVGFASRGEKVLDHRVSSFELLSVLPTANTQDRTRILREQTQRFRGTDFDQERNDINGRPPLLPDDQGNFPQPPQPDGIYDGDENVRLVDRSHIIPERPQFDLDPTFNGAAVGQYQLEIRVASAETTGRIAAGDLLDPRDRFAQSTTLIAPEGFEIVDGQFIELTNGDRTVRFEYEDTAIGDGASPGTVPITFQAGDSSAVVAQRIREAINNPFVSAALDVTASAPDRTVIGPADSNRVQIFGLVFPSPDSFVGFEVSNADESSNRAPLQGQILIDSNTISHSQMFGIVTEDGYRAVPDPFFFDPENLLVHSPGQIGDYSSNLGSAKDLITANEDNQIPSVVISNNVIARGGAGGIHASGDPGGFIITAPLGGAPYQTEVWDNYPFIFAITDHDGRTVNFEFDTDGALNTVIPAEPVSIITTPDCPYNDRACQPRTDVPEDPNMATSLTRAIQGSALDVTIWMDPLLPTQPIFIEGAADVTGIAAGINPDNLLLVDWFTPWYDEVPGLRTFSRIVNNTIVGVGGERTDNTQITVPILNPVLGGDTVKQILINDHTDAGVLVDDFAFPTILNNITVNLEAGIEADNSANDAIVGATLFQQNIESTKNINIGDFPIELGDNDPLFVDIDSDNFYLAASSLAIDSSVDSLEERPELATLKEQVGIARSNILAPDRDVIGQLREDDPSVETPSGLGQNVFKDRGAIDRVDFLGPTVGLLNPRDNDSEGVDKNSAETQVALEGEVLSNFTIQFVDSFRVGDPRDGTGIDPASISADSVVVTQDGNVLAPEVDYIFSFDATNGVIRLTPIAGVWPSGSNYVLRLRNDIRDIAGNTLRPNQQTGDTIFTISTVIGSDYGDAPTSYATLLDDNGPRHVLVPEFFLGAGATPDDDGQPNPNAASDGQDDGVDFPDILERDAVNPITVLASGNGFLDGWIDLNQNGNWNDAGEQVFTSEPLVDGVNALSVTIPLDVVAGDTFARFRFSSTGGLAPTGSAIDGEVEDYRVTIDPGNIWQNLANPLDTNADGTVSAVDVLRVIQEANSRRASDEFTSELFIPAIEPNTPQALGFVDVNGDGFATAADALSVIRFLNVAAAAGAAGEPEGAEGEPDTGLVAAALSSTPITVDPIGEIVENPVVSIPMQAPTPDLARAVVAVDDDLTQVIDELASEAVNESSEDSIDEALADMDWLSGDL